MLVMNPRSVSFDGELLEDVTSVVIDRRGERVVVEWSDEGPHAVFADVARAADRDLRDPGGVARRHHRAGARR